jgi:polysaccharide export outer membrane protein
MSTKASPSNSNARPARRPLLCACALLLAAALGAQPARADEPARLSLRMSDVLTPTSTAPGSMSRPNLRDYRIGADDLLEIQVFGVEQLSRSVRVNSRGQVSLPLVGTLDVGGLTAQEAEALITSRLADKFLQNPQVSLFIKEYTTQRVTIEGAVQKPGIYPLRGPTTLLRSLALAGGQASLSDMHEVMLFRADAGGKNTTLVYDVERIRSGELEDPSVVNDDLIVVKRSANRVFLRDSILRDVVDAINPFRYIPTPTP